MDALVVGAMVALAGLGLAGANHLHDRGAPGTLSRRIAPALAGAGYLAGVLWLDMWAAVWASAGLALALAALRLGFRQALRGISRSESRWDLGELAYPLAATASLAIGWGLLGDRWLGFLPVAFMSWGDSMAGLTRQAFRWRGRPDRHWGSAAMLGVCLAVAALLDPYWAGALAALAATIAERSRLLAHRFWAGNWIPDDPVIVAASLGVMAAVH